MKLAIVGKGGVGKTLLAATISRLFGRDGYSVIAVDADPNLNLGVSLGLGWDESRRVKPISEMKELIRERVGTGYGALLRMNPSVADIVDRYAIKCPDNVRLLVMGTVRGGGTGCLCPENAFLRSLLSHLIMGRKDILILDMAAGLEHLGRGTARGVDCMVCVVEPTLKSIETAARIRGLAGQIGVRRFAVVGNKIRGEYEAEFIRGRISGMGLKLLGLIPYDESVLRAEFKGVSLLDYNPKSTAVKAIEKIKSRIVGGASQGNQVKA